MSSTDPRDAVALAFAAQGLRSFKTEDWDHKAVLAALRENRRRNASHPYTQDVARAAAAVAEEISVTVGLPPADISAVLLAAGGSVGTLALLHPISAKTVAEVLQFAALELDQAGKAGEQL